MYMYTGRPKLKQFLPKMSQEAQKMLRHYILPTVIDKVELYVYI